MSLLLDALKKAEQAKREKVAAEVGGPSARPPASPEERVELRLEPMPEAQHPHAEGYGEA